MAGTMKFDLVSPERRLASAEATEVMIPGADGDMTAMEGHAPVILSLRPGILRVSGPEGTAEYALTGGFAEVTASSATVLAEQAVPRAELTAAFVDSMIAGARETAQGATGAARDAADRLLADLEALRATAA
ncbi:MAG: F0F1 ATP synthase subunit epsilon [Rhodobacteraceae bacterium]|jgi:F-type H+-transporting ATPase subunit epsilon|nr:F0F1 ATP synthase subunit epsilon [Paracoccaceae bacterium]